MAVASRSSGRIYGWTSSLYRLIRDVPMGAHTHRKADFELPSAEGDWGYPEDMLIQPSNNGGSVNGNGAAPEHKDEGEAKSSGGEPNPPQHNPSPERPV